MNFREHEKGGNLLSAIEHQKKMTSRTVGVLKLKTIIYWNLFLPALIEVTSYDKEDWSKGGNLPFYSLLMFKASTCLVMTLLSIKYVIGSAS